MRPHLLAVGLLIASVEAASIETGFQEEPMDELLRKGDIDEIEKLLANTWNVKPGSAAAKKLSTLWNESIACRCSSIAKVHAGEFGAQGTWMKLMTAIFPSESRSLADECPFLSLCLLYTDFIPMKAPAKLPDHWSVAMLLNPIVANTEYYNLNPDYEEDLVGALFDSVGLLGIHKRGCWLAQRGDLTMLNSMAEDIDTAIDLQDLFECHDDIAASPNTVDILRLLKRVFPKRLYSSVFWEPFLLATIKAEKLDLFQQLYSKEIEDIEVYAGLEVLIPAMPRESVRVLLDKREFMAGKLKYAVSANRVDIIRLAYEHSKLLPKNTAIVTAITKGYTEIIDFLEGVMGTDALRAIIASIVLEEELLDSVWDNGSVEAFKLLTKFMPELFPPEPARLVAPNTADNIELIQYVYQKLIEDVDAEVLIAPSSQRAKIMTRIIGHASSNFTPLYTGSVKLIRFFKGECTKYDVVFPAVSVEVIAHALEKHSNEFLQSYEDIFGQPIPHLAELAPRLSEFEFIQGWHFELFHKQDIAVNPTAEQLENMFDLESLKFIHQKYPRLLRLESIICGAVVNGHMDMLQWAFSLKEIPKDFTCEYLDLLRPENLQLYRLVREHYPQWLPTEEQMSNIAWLGYYNLVKWIFEVSNGIVYPSDETIESIIGERDITMLRLLDHLRPFSPAIIEQLIKFKDDPVLREWFPQYLSSAADHDSHVTSTSRQTNWELLLGFALMSI